MNPVVFQADFDDVFFDLSQQLRVLKYFWSKHKIFCVSIAEKKRPL